MSQSVSKNLRYSRSTIVNIEAAMREEIAAGGIAETPPLPLAHYFIPGAYARELKIPAGTLAVGKIHKGPCFNVISAGIITVITEDGRTHIEAPAFFRSEPGVKRVAYAHTDTVWTTIHATTETDISALEDQLTCTSYDEFNLSVQKDKEAAKCLLSQ